MNDTVDRLIQDRRARGADGTAQDLLSCMLTGVDRQSGEQLDDENISAQCITFLVAGHETTSGLLSFATYALLKNPDVLARAYEEVDRVLGTDLSVLPTYAQIHQLTYVSQILNETLRLWPTAPGILAVPVPRTPSSAASTRWPKGTRDTILISDAAPRPAGLGRRTPRRSTRTASARERRRRSRQRLQAVRHRAARLHRPAVRDAGGDPGARDGPPALRAGRLHRTTSSRSSRR